MTPAGARADARRGRRWLVTLAALLVMALTAALGVWQLSRAQHKLERQAAVERQAALPPLDGPALLALPDVDAALHRTAVLRGRWVPAATRFLDNRMLEGRAGFHVLTPLRLAGAEATVLVVRGWVPRDPYDRRRLPQVPTPEGEVQVQGRLAPPPSRLFELGPSEPGPIRQNIAIDALARETGLALLDVTLLQTSEADDGLRREWPRIAADVHKHYGYAFQWFGLCALVGILYVWFEFIQPRRRRPR
jgi:surfeit locus 1 family protein